MIIGNLRGVRGQLLLWTILPLSVVLIILSLAGIFRHRQAMTELIQQRDRSLVLAEATSLGQLVEHRSAPLATVASANTLSSDGATLAARVTALGNELDVMYPAGLAVFDSDGQALAASTKATTWSTNETARRLAQRVVASGANAIHFDVATLAGGQHLVLAAAATPANRALLAALPLDVLRLQDAAAHLQTETQGVVIILDETGQPLLDNNAPAPGQKVDLPALRGALANAQQPDGGLQLSAGRDPQIASYAIVEPLGWTLIGIEDLALVRSMSVNAVELVPIVVLFVAVLALLAVSFGVANIVRPLQELDRRAARVSWGDFGGLDEPVGGVAEIDELRASLAHMAERIRSYQAGMRDYLSAVTLAQEEERARLAHELHDDTVQALIALKHRTHMVRKALSPSRPEAAVAGNDGSEDKPAPPADTARALGRLDELETLIDGQLAALRRLISDLRPIYLEDLGFVPALEMLAKHTTDQGGPAVSMRVHGEPVRLAPDLELAAFRIMQQALHNVVTHANAQRATMEVTFDTDGITLIVQDDGMGFVPPEQPADLARDGHFGVMGMRERAILYGGRLTIDSAPGRGATVTAWLPIY